MKSLHDLQTVILSLLGIRFTSENVHLTQDLFYEWNKALASQYLSGGIICLLKTQNSN